MAPLSPHDWSVSPEAVPCWATRHPCACPGPGREQGQLCHPPGPTASVPPQPLPFVLCKLVLMWGKSTINTPTPSKNGTLKTWHIPRGRSHLGEGAPRPLGRVPGQAAAGPQQEAPARPIWSDSGDLKANPSPGSWQKMPRWAQAAGAASSAAIVPPSPPGADWCRERGCIRAWNASALREGALLRPPWSRGTPQPQRPKAAGWAAPASLRAGRAQGGASPFPGANLAVGEGVRGWEWAAPGCGRLAGGGLCQGGPEKEGTQPWMPCLFVLCWLYSAMRKGGGSWACLLWRKGWEGIYKRF